MDTGSSEEGQERELSEEKGAWVRSSHRGRTGDPGRGRKQEATGSAVRWKVGQKLLGDESRRSKTVARLFQN